MAALWGDNTERDIRDAMSQNFWHGVMTFLMWLVIIVGFSSPGWLWMFFTHAHNSDERDNIGESNQNRHRQVIEWNNRR